MAVNWEKYESVIDEAISSGAEKADEIIRRRSLGYLPLTEEEIKDVIPESANAKHLAELMKIVKSAESDNDKISEIFKNATKFGSIVLKLLDRFTRIS